MANTPSDADDEWTEFGAAGDPNRVPLPRHRDNKMKITIQGVAEFTWSPTLNHLAILSKLSGAHYDGACRACSTVGGIIYGWTQTVTHHDAQFGAIQCRGQFRDFDLCLKIMEGAGLLCNPDEMVLVQEMRNTFYHALRRANELYVVWREELS